MPSAKLCAYSYNLTVYYLLPSFQHKDVYKESKIQYQNDSDRKVKLSTRFIVIPVCLGSAAGTDSSFGLHMRCVI